jgi:hypothetical protein
MVRYWCVTGWFSSDRVRGEVSSLLFVSTKLILRLAGAPLGRLLSFRLLFILFISQEKHLGGLARTLLQLSPTFLKKAFPGQGPTVHPERLAGPLQAGMSSDPMLRSQLGRLGLSLTQTLDLQAWA